MITLNKRYGLLAALTVLTMPVLAQAQEGSDVFAKERFEFRLRGIGVLPNSGGDTSIGGTPKADNAFVPEFDISYFFTKNISAELILATSPHNLKLKDSALNPGGGETDLGDTWILPPTLTVQYHFLPESAFNPYVGAGINYTMPYKEDAAGGAITDLEADGSFGTALQVGADYWVNKHWGLNVDVKKIWVDVDAKVNGGAVTGNVELNPWVVGAGVSYRF